jgi:class 3 adenylate cyclase
MDRAAEATNGRRGESVWRRLLVAVRAAVRQVGSTGPGARRRARHVTVVHSDIVSSTQLLEAAGADYPRLLLRHRSLIAAAVARRGGAFLSHAGDGTLAVFDRADGALLASVEAQRALAAEPWPEGLVPRVRMGVHAGDVFDIEGEPVGLVIHHGARIMSAAQPGQVMVSAAAAEAAVHGGARVGGFSVADAGWHALRDHAGPVRLRQVVADGLTVVLPDSGHTIDLTSGTDRAADVEALLDGVT